MLPVILLAADLLTRGQRVCLLSQRVITLRLVLFLQTRVYSFTRLRSEFGRPKLFLVWEKYLKV